MADFVMIRKGRNALSSLTHILLNIALALISTALTVISGNWVFGVLLVILSKWRVVAVRPRYWWLNIKSNLVDFTVGLSLVLLVYFSVISSGTENSLNIWVIILTIIYAVWLVVIKPRSETVMAEVQSLFAVFFGTFTASVFASAVDPIVGVVICFIVGYGASRHVLVQGEEHDYTLTTFIFGLMLAELSWILYHWTIVYNLHVFDTVTKIPQLPIVATTLFFVLSRGYKSAVRHDGKIRVDDIALPAIFSALLMVVMIFLFSNPSFNI